MINVTTCTTSPFWSIVVAFFFGYFIFEALRHFLMLFMSRGAAVATVGLMLGTFISGIWWGMNHV